MYLHDFSPAQSRAINLLKEKQMNSKVTSIRTDDTPGKVISVPTSALVKLSASLAACTSELTKAESEQRAAEAILAEVPPDGFDHAAAGRSVAEARVSDLLNGGATADSVQQRCDRERVAAEAAATAFAKRQSDAQAQAERSSPMIAALRAQALELDRAVRHELVKLGIEMEAAAAQALTDAITAYTEAIIHYRAVSWLQLVNVVGERNQQFATHVETDILIGVPDALRDCLPIGWTPSPGKLARFDRYDLAGVVNERRRILMEAATSGLYPQAGAGLRRADQDGSES